jgi:hypothetical protein
MDEDMAMKQSVRRMYIPKTGLVLLGALFLGVWLATEVVAQTQLRNREFLNLSPSEEYQNYGRKEYEPYPQIISARNRYDRLGNFLMRGHKVFNWQLQRPGFSEINTRSEQYLGWFNAVIILNDSYRGWNYGLTLGEDIRTKLSDLTMQDPRYFGIRLDGQSADNKLTLLLSQGGSLASTSPNPKFSTFQATKERSSVMMFGGRWETQLGSALKVGATYFNHHMLDTFNESGSFLKGDTPYSMLAPSFITVAVEDDSPENDSPAVAYAMAIVVTGESQGQPIRLTSLEGDPDFDPILNPTIEGGTFVAGGGRSVSGVGERVTYTFQMPESVLPDPGDFALDPNAPLGGITIESVRFVADVAGDYRIGVKQQHLYFDGDLHESNLNNDRVPGDRRYANPYTGLTGDDALLTPSEAIAAGNEDVFKQWPVEPNESFGIVNPFTQFKWDTPDPSNVFYTVARAEGGGVNPTGRKRVEFDYGIPTGQALYGLDGELNVKGLHVKGEFITNPQYFIFPVGSNAGKRFSKRAWAYFINASKEVGPFEAGAEIFNLQADYSGNYDSRRGGVPFFTDDSSAGSQMQEMFVMTDNDDNDQWPDDLNVELPSADKQESGIFPGLDENRDWVPDTDQNLNSIPDWQEPILFYDADPAEFVYGIDFNNNGVVDYRENDNLPDYPYRRDRKGYHLFITRDNLGRFGKWLSLGYYSMEQEAGPGEANSVYARYYQNIVSPYFGKLSVNFDTKWVEDSVRDDVYIWRDLSERRIESPFPQLTGRNIEERDLNSQLIPPTTDPLLMRKSWVNNLFAESRYSPILDLNIINNLQWTSNKQSDDEFDDGVVQEENTLSQMTMINKIDYTLRLGKLDIKPMFKHLLLRERSDRVEKVNGAGELVIGTGNIRSFSIYTPILRIRYDLTTKSNLQLGFQGFPFWQYRSVDRVDKSQDFDEWNLVFMMSNRSDYYGFALASQFGWTKTSRTYDDKVNSALDLDNSSIFFDIIAGF